MIESTPRSDARTISVQIAAFRRPLRGAAISGVFDTAS
jgi:hypothetical protein